MAEVKLCAVEGCSKTANIAGVSSGGFCSVHYRRFLRHGDPTAGGAYRFPPKACSIDGCDRVAVSRTFCPAHYQKWRAYGDPLAEAPRYRARERWLTEHRDFAENNCLTWPFPRNESGRGFARLNGRDHSAPRAMCILAHGDPPTLRHQAAHTCGKGHLGCVNPRHLRWATPKENEKDKERHGTLRRGRAVNTARLSEDDVRIIRASVEVSGRDLAEQFGVTPAAISAIRRGRNWRWLK